MAQDDKIAVQRNTSKLRQHAKRVGIIVEFPKPRLPMTEQEQADIM